MGRDPSRRRPGGRPRPKGTRGGNEPAQRRSDPRALAVEILERVEQGAYLDAMLGDALNLPGLSPADAGLLTRIGYGTVAWQRRLDWTLASLLNRELSDLDAPVRAALRVGLFQLVLLDRVPAHAAVDTTVRALRRRANKGAAGLVNAVLRRFVREPRERAFPDPAEDPVRHLGIRWSHPDWVVARWLEQLGPDAVEARLRANNEAAPTALRIDRRRISRDDALAQLAEHGLAVRPGVAPDALLLESPLRDLPREDWLQVQGEASQLVVDLMGVRSGERVTELCAAPGGKSRAMHERGAWVAAVDRSRRGLTPTRSRGVEAGSATGGITPICADGGRPPLRDGQFDAVLVDAPCSGLGTLRSHPEIRWRLRDTDPARLADEQLRLLSAGARLVRPGGRLVFSVCTLSPEENEGVASRFAAASPGFIRVDPTPHLPEGARRWADSESRCFTPCPEDGGLDGFWAARFERRGDGHDPA